MKMRRNDAQTPVATGVCASFRRIFLDEIAHPCYCVSLRRIHYKEGSVADASGPTLPVRPRVDAIAFQEDELQAVVLDGREVVLPVRPICTVLGLDPDSQVESLQQHDVLAQGLRYVRIPVGNRFQTVLAIHRRYLYFWLAGIRPSLVRPEIRPKLKAYQEELVELLNAVYGAETDLVAPPAEQTQGITPSTVAFIARQMRALATQLRQELADSQGGQDQRITQLEELVRGQLTTVQGQLDETQQRLLDHVKITSAQQAVIRLAIQRIAKRYQKRTGKEIYDMLHARLCAELGTPRYDALPAAKYERALEWLRERAAEYLPDDPDALPGLQTSML